MVMRNSDVHDTGPRVLVRANSDEEEAADSFVVEVVPAVLPVVLVVLAAAPLGNTRGDGARPGFVEFHRNCRCWGIATLTSHCRLLLRRRIRAIIAFVVVVDVVVPAARLEGSRPTVTTGNRMLGEHR